MASQLRLCTLSERTPLTLHNVCKHQWYMFCRPDTFQWRSIEPGGLFGPPKRKEGGRGQWQQQSGWVTYMEIGALLWWADKSTCTHPELSSTRPRAAVWKQFKNYQWGWRQITVQTSVSRPGLIVEREPPHFSTMLHLSFCGSVSSWYWHCFVILFTSTEFYHSPDTKVEQRDILLRNGANSPPLVSLL